MYEDSFGTDWDDLDDREDAVRRAFALGVAARLGERHPGELDRISRAVGSTYDRSFVELAYHEGRDKAKDVQPTVDSDEELWAELVEGEADIDPSDRPEPDVDDGDDSEVPEAVRRFEVDSRPDDSREVVGQPKFLSREGAEEPDRRNRARRSRGKESTGDDEDDLSEEEHEEFEELLEPDDDED